MRSTYAVLGGVLIASHVAVSCSSPDPDTAFVPSEPGDVQVDVAAPADVSGQPELPSFPDASNDADDVEDADGDGGIDGGLTGVVGDPCQQNIDCESGICLFFDPSATTGFCSDDCTEATDCPEGWVCATFTDSGSDAVMRCIEPELCLDRDQDGYGEGPGCAAPDCDDTRSDVSPLADEVCNGLDDDCDSRIDDNPVDERRECETGFVGRCASGQTRCADGLLECDAVAATGEDVCDGADNDCDGVADEDGICDGVPCCYLERCDGVCETARRNGDGTCVQPPAYSSDESCDGLDNDCDGTVDEDAEQVFWADADRDGFGDSSVVISGCVAPPGYVDNDRDCDDTLAAVRPDAVEVCDGLDNDCDNDTDSGVCGDLACCWDDTCVGVCGTARTDETGTCTVPAAFGDERCDSLDNNCDGRVDEGNPGAGVACSTGLPGVCEQGFSICSGDVLCVQTTFPSVETCDDRDNDCDGTVDEGNPGGGSACFTGLAGVCSLGVTACQAGANTCVATVSASPEVCDGIDNDCDGVTDQGNPGGGVPCNTGRPSVCSEGITACVSGATVCQQTQFGTSEICDGIDNDCDGVIDEGTTCSNCIQRNNGSQSYLFCGRRFLRWNNANDACASLGRYRLVTIDSPAENAWVQSEFLAAAWSTCDNSCPSAFDAACSDGGVGSGVTLCDYGTDCWDCGPRTAPTNLWIGLTDSAVEGTFAWASGGPVVWTNWEAGEPNNLNDEEDCAEMRLSNGLWNDNRCDNTAVLWPWVCESF